VATSDARGYRSSIVVQLTDDSPEAELTLGIAAGAQGFSADRPTYCLCEPEGFHAGDEVLFDYPQAIVPDTEVSESGASVVVSFDRLLFDATGWPSRWRFSVLHELPGGTASEPPDLLRLASGWVVMPDVEPQLVVASAEVQ